jgi:hypothetical protein
MVEKDGLKERPNGIVAPMLGQDVRRVAGAGAESVRDGTSGDGLSNGVKGKHVVALMELTVRLCRAVDDSLVVSSKDGRTGERNPEIEEGELVSSDLVACGACGDGLGAESRGLDGVLFLGEPVGGGLVEIVEYTGDGFPR